MKQTSIRIESIPIRNINAAAYNPRKDLKPSDAEYMKLKKSIDEFGYIEPIVVNRRTGNIVGGHQRFKILVDEGYTEVECVVVNLAEKREKALNVALNKISGEWDTDKLKAVLSELDEADLVLSGFDLLELDNLFNDSLGEDLDLSLDEAGGEKKKSGGMVTCPNCGHKFKA